LLARVAQQGITPERLIVMTEAQLNTELGMGRLDVRRINTHLRSIRERLEKKEDIKPPVKQRTGMHPQVRAHRTHHDVYELPPSQREVRAQIRDRRKSHAIRDMLPSLRVMPAQATPASAASNAQPTLATQATQSAHQQPNQAALEKPQQPKKSMGVYDLDDDDGGRFIYNESDVIDMESDEVSILVPDDDQDGSSSDEEF
jgi:hypothetical protein